MYIYGIMLGISLLFAKLAANAKPYEKIRGSYYTFAVMSFLPFAAVTMLRWQVGTDWPIYDSYYYYINHGIQSFSEPLFNLLNKFLYLFSEDSSLLFAVVGFFTLLMFFLAIYQQSPMIPFSVLLFFLTNKYFTSLNQIRQMLAMSIFFFSLKYIFQRNILAYYTAILTAMLIHTSSAIYLPVYFLYGKEWESRGLIKAFIVYCLLLPAVSLFARLTAHFTRFAWYFDSAYNQNDFYAVGFLVSFLAMALHLFAMHRTGKHHVRLGFMTIMTMLSCMILLLTSSLPQVARISEGFAVVQILSIPEMAKAEQNRRIRRLYLCFFILLYGCKLFYDVYHNHWYGVLPYHTIFFRG